MRPRTPREPLNYDLRMEKARERIARMIESEHSAGFGVPEEGTSFELLRTIQFALEAGITNDDWPCVEEAKVMVDTLVDRFIKGRIKVAVIPRDMQSNEKNNVH